ncbi:YitT family protein [Streptomyces fildesensis]|uniref:YitT family protein n=1 Tax=Streptomyces fildesensis TaxID=375757 RepID=A0ABW8C4G5_9ACTN
MPQSATYLATFTRGVTVHTGRRIVHLYVGLVLYGASDGLLVGAGLGLDPWDVFHQGISDHSGLSIGMVSIVVGAAVLLLWLPLRQRPGLGTVSNVFIVGLAMDGTLRLLPEVHALGVRIPLLVAAIVLNGVATGLYITARFGPGPRDGLMTGLHRRTGRSIRLVRTGIELTVLAVGFLLGGSVGVGTVLYAVAIGPLAQYFLRFFEIPQPTGQPAAAPEPEPVAPPERDLEPERSPAVAACGNRPVVGAAADPAILP